MTKRKKVVVKKKAPRLVRLLLSIFEDACEQGKRTIRKYGRFKSIGTAWAAATDEHKFRLLAHLEPKARLYCGCGARDCSLGYNKSLPSKPPAVLLRRYAKIR